MIIDAILDHLYFVEQFDSESAETRLTPAEIDYIRRGALHFGFTYIVEALENQVSEYTTRDIMVKKALIRYIVEQDYNLDIIPRILKFVWC